MNGRFLDDLGPVVPGPEAAKTLADARAPSLANQAGLSDVEQGPRAFTNVGGSGGSPPMPQDPRMLAYKNQQSGQLAQQAWDRQPQQPVQTAQPEVIPTMRAGSTEGRTGAIADRFYNAVSPALRRMREPGYQEGGYVDDEGLEGQGADDATMDPMAMVSSALSYGKKKYGIESSDQQGEMGFDEGGVVPTQDAQAQGNPNAIDPRQAMAYLAGDGAVSPEIAQALEQRVDPQGQLDPTQRAMAAIGVAPDDEARFGLIQHYRTKYNGFAGAAKAALARGDLGEAAKQASLAMGSVPNGKSTQFAPAQGGLAMVERPAFGGGAPQQQSYARGGYVQGFDDGGYLSPEDESVTGVAGDPLALPELPDNYNRPTDEATLPEWDVPYPHPEPVMQSSQKYARPEPIVQGQQQRTPPTPIVQQVSPQTPYPDEYQAAETQPQVLPTQQIVQMLDQGFDANLAKGGAEPSGAAQAEKDPSVIGPLWTKPAWMGAVQDKAQAFGSWMTTPLGQQAAPAAAAAPAEPPAAQPYPDEYQAARAVSEKPATAPVTTHPVTQKPIRPTASAASPAGAVVDDERWNPITKTMRPAAPGTFGTREAARRAGTDVPMTPQAAGGSAGGNLPQIRYGQQPGAAPSARAPGETPELRRMHDEEDVLRRAAGLPPVQARDAVGAPVQGRGVVPTQREPRRPSVQQVMQANQMDRPGSLNPGSIRSIYPKRYTPYYDDGFYVPNAEQIDAGFKPKPGPAYGGYAGAHGRAERQDWNSTAKRPAAGYVYPESGGGGRGGGGGGRGGGGGDQGGTTYHPSGYDPSGAPAFGTRRVPGVGPMLREQVGHPAFNDPNYRYPNDQQPIYPARMQDGRVITAQQMADARNAAPDVMSRQPGVYAPVTPRPAPRGGYGPDMRRGDEESLRGMGYTPDQYTVRGPGSEGSINAPQSNVPIARSGKQSPEDLLYAQADRMFPAASQQRQREDFINRGMSQLAQRETEYGKARITADRTAATEAARDKRKEESDVRTAGRNEAADIRKAQREADARTGKEAQFQQKEERLRGAAQDKVRIAAQHELATTYRAQVGNVMRMASTLAVARPDLFGDPDKASQTITQMARQQGINPQAMHDLWLNGGVPFGTPAGGGGAPAPGGASTGGGGSAPKIVVFPRGPYAGKPMIQQPDGTYVPAR